MKPTPSRVLRLAGVQRRPGTWWHCITYGSPFLSAADTPDAARTVVNEGVRISAIVA